MIPGNRGKTLVVTRDGYNRKPDRMRAIGLGRGHRTARVFWRGRGEQPLGIRGPRGL